MVGQCRKSPYHGRTEGSKSTFNKGITEMSIFLQFSNPKTTLFIYIKLMIYHISKESCALHDKCIETSSTPKGSLNNTHQAPLDPHFASGKVDGTFIVHNNRIYTSTRTNVNAIADWGQVKTGIFTSTTCWLDEKWFLQSLMCQKHSFH